MFQITGLARAGVIANVLKVDSRTDSCRRQTKTLAFLYARAQFIVNSGMREYTTCESVNTECHDYIGKAQIHNYNPVTFVHSSLLAYVPIDRLQHGQEKHYGAKRSNVYPDPHMPEVTI
jgi:hypothetical protein